MLQKNSNFKMSTKNSNFKQLFLCLYLARYQIHIMSKRTNRTKRNKAIDVLFIIDATNSMKNTFKAVYDKAEDIAFDLQVSNRTFLFKYGCICYRDPVDVPSEVHQVFDFDEEIEYLAEFLESVKPSGSGDEPGDYVGALNEALNNLSWRDEGIRMIVWIANCPAHGQRFYGKLNH